MKPTSPPAHQPLYKLNCSTLLNQDKSNLSSSIFNVNLCLTSPSLDTPNKIFAISLLSQNISKYSLPSSQVYYLIYKCLKYLTTQNTVEPILLMNCFLNGSNHLEQNDISFEFYLKRLIKVLAQKHKIALKETLLTRINECECQLDSNIQKYELHLSNHTLFKEMNLIKNVIETILNNNTINNDDDKYYYYIMSVHALQTAVTFVNEYLTYEHKSKDEFNVFIKKAFEPNKVKFAFYNDKYPYNIYTKQKNNNDDDGSSN